MGLIADHMAEAIERTNNDVVVALRKAGTVEFLTDAEGRVWVNIDGFMAIRIDHVDNILVDTSNSPAQLNKVIR